MVAVCDRWRFAFPTRPTPLFFGKTTGLEELIELHMGDIVQTTDCHQHPVTGEIIQLLEHTVIVAKGEERVVVPKKNIDAGKVIRLRLSNGEKRS